MARIGGIDHGSGVLPARAGVAGKTGPAFIVAGAFTETPAGTEALGGTGGVALLGAMLAAQEWGDPTAQDREGRRHGRAVLDLLAELQRALLAGMGLAGINEGASGIAQRLAALASVEPAAADPALASVLAAIRLRARVELARLGVEAGA